MKTKLFIAAISAFALLISSNFAFAQSLSAPSTTIGTTVTASVPMSKNVAGRYTGSATNYEVGVYHSGGTREWGSGGNYTSIYRKQCASDPCGTITTTAGGSIAINFSTAATWTAQ